MNLAAWETTHPLEAIAIAQKAEDDGRFFTDAELHQLRELTPQQADLLPVVAVLRDRADRSSLRPDRNYSPPIPNWCNRGEDCMKAIAPYFDHLITELERFQADQTIL